MTTKKFIVEDVFYNAKFNDDYTIHTDIKSTAVSDIMKHMHDDSVKPILMNNKTHYDFDFLLKALLTDGLLSEDTLVNLHIYRDACAQEYLILDTSDYTIELGVPKTLGVFTDKNTGTRTVVKNRTQLKNRF